MVEARWWHRLGPPIAAFAVMLVLGVGARRAPTTRRASTPTSRPSTPAMGPTTRSRPISSSSPATPIATSATRRRPMPATPSPRPRSWPAIRPTSGVYVHSHGDFYGANDIQGFRDDGGDCSQAIVYATEIKKGRNGGANLVVMSTCHLGEAGQQRLRLDVRGLRHRAQAERPVGRRLPRSGVLPRLPGSGLDRRSAALRACLLRLRHARQEPRRRIQAGRWPPTRSASPPTRHGSGPTPTPVARRRSCPANCASEEPTMLVLSHQHRSPPFTPPAPPRPSSPPAPSLGLAVGIAARAETPPRSSSRRAAGRRHDASRLPTRSAIRGRAGAVAHDLGIPGPAGPPRRLASALDLRVVDEIGGHRPAMAGRMRSSAPMARPAQLRSVVRLDWIERRRPSARRPIAAAAEMPDGRPDWRSDGAHGRAERRLGRRHGRVARGLGCAGSTGTSRPATGLTVWVYRGGQLAALRRSETPHVATPTRWSGPERRSRPLAHGRCARAVSQAT